MPILIIDDEDKLRGLLARTLELEGLRTVQAATAKSGLALLNTEDVELVLTDVKLPDANGVELTRRIKAARPDVEVIVLTAYGTIADGVRAIQNGAFDYLVKGDDNERILPLVNRALEKVALQRKVRVLEQKISRRYGFDNILGGSAAIAQARHLAQRVAQTNATVLLLGQTGTGKEVFAQAVHYAGQRADRPFVAVNCSALGRDILESELFGYRAGAFTGAVRDKKGLLEEAEDGTVFLDEIVEMSLDLQAKLLRVLETNEFYKVGETKPTRVNVRFVAATNRELQQEAENGRFRLDLYFRLSVFTITLPSLNERTEDIPLLAGYFLKEAAFKANRRIERMTPEFVEQLVRHQWKGNIRELKNVLERAVILCEGDTLTPDLLPYEFKQGSPAAAGEWPFELAEMEKRHIARVLAHTHGNKTEAARLLGIGLTTLYRKLEEFGF